MDMNALREEIRLTEAAYTAADDTVAGTARMLESARLAYETAKRTHRDIGKKLISLLSVRNAHMDAAEASPLAESRNPSV